ncbi:MAG TPA: SIMPL domain-containing protein [Candidatus Paceibacterota bacterium]|nr:SIMPL domain-containing protein [Candidatus Paceibacterota bacterium]
MAGAEDERFFDKPFVLPAIVLGIGIILSAAVVSYTLYAMRSLDNTLSVTGSAKQDVKADSAKWTVQVYRGVSEEGVSAAYGQVARDADAVKAYFAQAGIPEADISVTTVVADQDWSYNQNGGPKRYNVHEDITIQSDDVEKIRGLSQNIGALAAKGLSIMPQQPQYFVSTLPELRVQLLGAAIADAKARAQSIAGTAGAGVGRLKSASSGVVQVLAPNATNVEDYGSYDTSTIDKEVMVTARATFLVR